MDSYSEPASGCSEQWCRELLAAARASGGDAPGVTFEMVMRKLAEVVVMVDNVRLQGGFAVPLPPARDEG